VRRIRALAATVVVGASALASAPAIAASHRPGSGQFSAAVQTRLQNVVNQVRRLGVPGVAVAVVVPGTGTFVRTVGTASYQLSTPVTSSTHFRIGSITKTLTATAALQLVAAGKLSLTDTIDQWVPQVQNANEITVQMLLNMTAGIADEGAPGSLLDQQVAANPTQAYTPEQIVALAVQQGPAAAPGTFVYSDTNYAILGIIAQDVSGTAIPTLLQRVAGKAGLTGTSYPTTTAIPTPAAVGYAAAPGQHAPANPFDPSQLGAAGAMISDLTDLRAWAPQNATGRFLTAAMQRARVQTVPTGITFAPLPKTGVTAPLTVAYGLGIANASGWLGHNGVAPGFTSEMWYLPAKKATIVVLLNAEVVQNNQIQPVADEMFASFARIVNP